MLDEFKPIIRNKNFLLLWTSQVLSQLTINILNFLLLIKIFEATSSTIATSFLWVAYALPAIIIGPFAAASVDMVDRKKLLVITNFLQAATILIYALSHQSSTFLLYSVAIVYSFLNQFYVPAELASLPTLLPKKDLAHANGLLFITHQAAVVFGFGIAGIMGSFLGFTSSLYICSILLIFALISVSGLPSMSTGDTLPKEFEKAFIKFFLRIKEGYLYIKNNNLVLTPIVILLAMHVSLVMIVVNIPIIATEIFNVSLNWAGLLIAAPAGVGAAIGAVTIPKLLKKGWRKMWVIEVSFIALSITLAYLIFILPFISNYQRILANLIGIMFIGISFIGIIIPTQTFLQENIPGGLRGRVFGNYWFLATVATVFPVIFSGAITELFGAKIFILLLSIISLVAFIFISKHGRKFVQKDFKFTFLRH